VDGSSVGVRDAVAAAMISNSDTSAFTFALDLNADVPLSLIGAAILEGTRKADSTSKGLRSQPPGTGSHVPVHRVNIQLACAK
jgi:hypothetical protein